MEDVGSCALARQDALALGKHTVNRSGPSTLSLPGLLSGLSVDPDVGAMASDGFGSVSPNGPPRSTDRSELRHNELLVNLGHDAADERDGPVDDEGMLTDALQEGLLLTAS